MYLFIYINVAFFYLAAVSAVICLWLSCRVLLYDNLIGLIITFLANKMNERTNE